MATKTTGSEDRGAAFGELRSAVQAGATQASWDRLCAALRGWPDRVAMEEEALPYAAQATASWPSSLRAAPPWMVREALQGRPALLSGLCAHVEIKDKLQPNTLRRLLRDGVLSGLETLTLLPGANAQGEAVELMMSDQLPRLHTLELRGQVIQDRHLRVLRSATHGPPLRVLSLAENRLRGGAAAELVAWRGAAQLEALILDDNDWAPELEASKFELPALRTLSLRRRYGPDRLSWLLETPVMDQLTGLSLGAMWAPGEVIEDFLSHPVCAQLAHFDCDWTGWYASQAQLDALRALEAERGAAWSEAVRGWVEAISAKLRQTIEEEAMYAEDYDDGWE